MSLPIVRMTSKFILPISKKEVIVEEWSVPEVRIFSSKMEIEKDNSKAIEILDEFMNKHIKYSDESEFIFSELNYLDGYALSIELREFSKGTAIVERLYNCECGHVSQIVKIDLSKYDITKPTTNIIELRENLSISFKQITVKDTLSNPTVPTLCLAIDKVFYDNNEYDCESVDVAVKFINDLGESDFKKLNDLVTSVIGSIKPFTTKCMSCDRTSVFNIRYHDFFL